MNKEQRISQIDFIKGVAVLLVILYHSASDKNPLRTIFIGQAVPLFMLMTGYLSVASWQRYNLTIRSYFKASRLIKLFQRIIVPLSIVLLIDTFYFYVRHPLNLKSWMPLIKRGGSGPGSYYPYIFLQSWIFIPFLIKFSEIEMDKNKKIFIIFTISILVESFCSLINIPSWLYRVCFIRYIFVIYLGICWQQKTLKLNATTIALATGGLLYILADNYSGNIFAPIIYPDWKGWHAPAYFYSFICAIAIWSSYSITPKPISKLMNRLGAASYHIFLVQMIYFSIVSDYFQRLFGSIFPRQLIAIATCSIAGIFWFILDEVIIF